MPASQAPDSLLDVPSPIDLRNPGDAAEWAALAMERRPWRVDFFERFAQEIGDRPCRVLELGSGPGFLAEHLLKRLPALKLDLLDFSAAMHVLARERLGPLAAPVRFIEASFKEPGWTTGLGGYDFVITHQAVHEIRHKRHVPALHAQVRTLLAPGGAYLMCDHFFGDGGMSHDRLYMSRDEQRAALAGAGFATVDELMCKGGLSLWRAAAA
jgi:SAM-dependent methyltransferase